LFTYVYLSIFSVFSCCIFTSVMASSHPTLHAFLRHKRAPRSKINSWIWAGDLTAEPTYRHLVLRGSERISLKSNLSIYLLFKQTFLSFYASKLNVCKICLFVLRVLVTLTNRQFTQTTGNFLYGGYLMWVSEWVNGSFSRKTLPPRVWFYKLNIWDLRSAQCYAVCGGNSAPTFRDKKSKKPEIALAKYTFP
jgi:hypothetical protein